MIMAINGIQFQKGLSLVQFMKDYGTEEQCEAAFILTRWPRGFECVKCAHCSAYEFSRSGRHYWQCKGCNYQCTLRAGTIMEHSQLPLTKWYLAIYLMTQSKTNIAALAMMRQLDVTWKAAWLLKHKLMEVMAQREEDRPLQGDVSVDDAYLGGERTGGGPGRGSKNKVAFVAAVEMKEGRPQRVRFDPVAGFSFAALTPWAKQAIAPGSTVTSDGLLGFEVLERLNYKHKVVQAPRGKAGTEIEPFKWLNIVLGNLKTALSGTHHAFKFAKYARRYLAEVQYRFNRRSDLASMVPRLATAVAQTRPCSARRILGKSEVKT
jgi:transposase-like protein